MKDKYDFSGGKRGAVLPSNGKTRVTFWIDDDILEAFRYQANAEGVGFQALINQTLRAVLEQQSVDPLPIDEEFENAPPVGKEII